MEFQFPAYPEPSSCSCYIKMTRFRYWGLGGNDRYGIEENDCGCFGINRVMKLDGKLESVDSRFPEPRVLPCPISPYKRCSDTPRFEISHTPNFASCGYGYRGNGLCATPCDRKEKDTCALGPDEQICSAEDYFKGEGLCQNDLVET